MKMTIRELAERRAQLDLNLHVLRMSGVPADPDERVKANAQYEIVWAAFVAADKAYNDAIKGLSPEELEKIAAA